MKKTLAFLFAIACFEVSLACNEGFEAFQKTVFEKVRRDCVKCHDGKRPEAPPFAVNDPQKSYQHLLNYMNFGKIEESILVFRAGNGHCKEESCEFESGLEMEEKAREWWNSGEKSCNRNGKYFSAEVALPEKLPTPKEGFQTLTFDLSPIDRSLEGISFQFDIQEYIPTSNVTKGAYRIRSPRFIGGQKAIKVKDIKILLNGMYDSVYNAYTFLSKTVPFVRLDESKMVTPVLSGLTLILLKDGLANPKLSVSFMEINIAEEAPCISKDIFKRKVIPTLFRMRCDTCHNNEISSTGTRILNMEDEPGVICQSATALVDRDSFYMSPLIAYPTRGHLGHESLGDVETREFIDAVKLWINQGMRTETLKELMARAGDLFNKLQRLIKVNKDLGENTLNLCRQFTEIFRQAKEIKPNLDPITTDPQKKEELLRLYVQIMSELITLTSELETAVNLKDLPKSNDYLNKIKDKRAQAHEIFVPNEGEKP